MFTAETVTGETVNVVDKGYIGDTLVVRTDDGKTFSQQQYGDKLVPFEVEAAAEPEADPDAVDPNTGEGGTEETIEPPEGETT